MPIDLQRCTVCMTAAHPPRALCPVCGAAAWVAEPCGTGIVEECTTVSGTSPVILASVRASSGPVIVAALSAALPPGTAVSLQPGPLRSILAQPVAAVQKLRLISQP